MRNIRVFVSSPGDVKDERQVIAEVVDSFNNRAAWRDTYKFTAYLYERFAPALTGEAPQDVVNDQMLRPSDTDLVVCVFWSRFGTPLAEINPDTKQPYGSGTEFEFYDAYRAYRKRRSPTILLYRCIRPAPDSADPDQLARVDAFFKRFEGSGAPLSGLYKRFDTLDSLRAALTNDIETVVANWDRPTQRLMDQVLRPMWPVLALMVVLIAALALLVLRPSTPPAAPTLTATPLVFNNGQFNVAVAPFSIAAGKFTDAELKTLATLPQDVTNAFVADFQLKLSDINGVSEINTWQPDQIAQVSTTPVTDDSSAQAVTDALKEKYGAYADLLIYGVITKDDAGKRIVVPGFYVTEKQPDLDEVRGRFNLDAVTSVSSLSSDTALKLGLTSRAQVLAYAAYGLSLMSAQQYQAAIDNGFDPILGKMESYASNASTVIYVLKGSAAVSAYNVLSASSSPRQDAINKALATAEDSFGMAAAQSNGDYARALLGVASTHYLRLLEDGQPDVADLNQVLADYDRAAKAKDQPAGANIPLKIAFGRGQVYAYRYENYGDDSIFLQGHDALSQAVELGKNIDNPQIREIVGRAYALRGDMLVTRAVLNGDPTYYAQAIEDYESAGDTSQVPASQALYKRRLTRTRFDMALVSGDAAAVESAFTAFVSQTTPVPPVDELAEVWQDKGHYYRDNGRDADAIAAYESALQLDLSSQAKLAASLWFDLGSEFDGLCRLPEAAQDFRRTVALDGSSPNYTSLPKLIQRYEHQEACF